MKDKRQVYLLVFLASGGGFLTQTLVSGFWVSAFSDDILTYALHVSTYFFSLGMGAYFAEKIQDPNRNTISLITVLSGFVLASAIPFMKCLIVLTGGFLFLPLFILFLQGILVGAIVPIALIVYKPSSKVTLGKLFFVDYISALVLSSLFTWVLLIPLGFTNTGLILGLIISFLAFLSSKFEPKKAPVFFLGVLSCLILFYTSDRFISHRRSQDKDTKVVFSKQSHYQKIVLMEEKPNEPFLQGEKQYVLYLDGFLQFASSDEQSYHACIANIPLQASLSFGRVPKNVLILGGGDGLAARNILLTKGVEKVTLVELDPMMIQLAKFHPILKEQNLGSLLNPKMRIITEDAFLWTQKTGEKFDLVIVDFPLPKNLTLARLYSSEFYRKLFDRMEEHGIVAVQAGPSYSYEDPGFQTLSKVTASILKTIEGLDKKAWPYLSVLDNEAFVISSNDASFNFEEFATKNSLDADRGMGKICAFQKNWKLPEVETNTLNKLPIAGYMMDWIRGGKNSFFHYRGVKASFLPD